MSKDIVLYCVLKRTFALLLENENLGENCELLVQKLDERIQELRKSYGIINELLTSLSNLKSGFVSLRACFKYLPDDTAKAQSPESDFEEVLKQTSAPNEVSQYGCQNTETENPACEKTKRTDNSEDNDRLLSCPNDAKLQKELRAIKESEKFKLAIEYFRQSNAFSRNVFEKENKEEIKMTAAKVRVISEILGNLTNLSSAADNCRKYISQLNHGVILNQHNIFSNWTNVLQVHLLGYPEKKSSMVGSIIHLNVVVFRFMKEFTRKPVVMLDWPMIGGQDHPILGKLPTGIDPPDPFTRITDINKEKVEIVSSIAAINCIGDIFAKEKASTDIVRITSNCNKWYSLKDDSGEKIVSIAIDCTDCETPTKSQLGETSTMTTQSSTASPGQTSLVCRGKMYILARNKSQNDFCYFLYVVDMNGMTKHSKKLRYLKRSKTENQQVKIFCVSDQKLVILEFTRRARSLRICDHEGELQEKIDITAELQNPHYSIAYNGEIICSNDEGMLNIYNINEEKRLAEKPLSKTNEIEIKRTVQAVAYNHKLEEFIVLCFNVRARLKQYYLVTYTKSGQLIQDIELNNANHEYEEGKLMCHQSGPAVLFDNHKLLYLKR